METGSGTTYKQFFFRPDGTQMGIYAGALTQETIPLPGGETAVYNGSGLNYIRHTDWLGSSRLATTWAHAVYSKEAYAPFGETYNEAGTPDRSFTGQDQDVASGAGGTGTYDFLFRKYDPAAGRWLSPDPYGWGAVDQTTPQSLNRYAYVDNNPMEYIDPTGYTPVTIGGSCAYYTDSSIEISTGVDDTTWTYGNFYCYPPYTIGGANPGNNTGNGNGTGNGNSNAPNNGRNCSVGSASASQYAVATAQVALMTEGFIQGLGPDQYTFDPNSSISQVMAQSTQFQSVLNQYYMLGATSGWENFGAVGFVQAGFNPVAQFLGSFGWNITPINGGIIATITNVTSFHSLMGDHGPAYNRSPVFQTPMGNISQTINIRAVCQ